MILLIGFAGFVHLHTQPSAAVGGERSDAFGLGKILPQLFVESLKMTLIVWRHVLCFNWKSSMINGLRYVWVCSVAKMNFNENRPIEEMGKQSIDGNRSRGRSVMKKIDWSRKHESNRPMESNRFFEKWRNTIDRSRKMGSDQLMKRNRRKSIRIHNNIYQANQTSLVKTTTLHHSNSTIHKRKMSILHGNS